MKYNVNGRECETWNLSNEELLSLYKDGEYKGDEGLLKAILNRFECDLCRKSGETNDDVFARFFSNFVNGKMRSPKEVAKKMVQDHRYLQQEMFKVCIEYIKILAENYGKGWFDGRNEWASKVSAQIVEDCKEKEIYI